MDNKIPDTFNDWREARRFRAWELKQEGWKQTDIAEALGVSDAAVSQWMKRVREGGLEALRTRTGGGPEPKISEEELQKLPEFLEAGPEAYGFRGDVWTRARVGAVIEEEFGVSYSDVHVGRLLKKIGWSRQKPAERASQREEAEIEEWEEETWPEIKKKPLKKTEPSSS
jgi:transposase